MTSGAEAVFAERCARLLDPEGTAQRLGSFPLRLHPKFDHAENMFHHVLVKSSDNWSVFLGCIESLAYHQKV